jgi:hypothetical protein
VRRSIVAIVLAALLTGSWTALYGPAAHATAPEPKWSAWSEFGGVVGSDDASRGELALFAPLLQNPDTIVFVDLRGKFFEEDVQEGNYAVGFRKMHSSGWNFGLWIGYDVRYTRQDNTFHQIAGGFPLGFSGKRLCAAFRSGILSRYGYRYSAGNPHLHARWRGGTAVRRGRRGWLQAG